MLATCRVAENVYDDSSLTKNIDWQLFNSTKLASFKKKEKLKVNTLNGMDGTNKKASFIYSF